MELNYLLERIKKINNFIDLNHSNRTDSEKLLLKSAKITEELGELYNELLLFLDFSRDGKPEFNKENLEKEIADILISTLLVSISLGIDIEKALESKLNKVYNRYNLN
nr:MazG nucleotide pyrophosphohydrolase domain-containing protein [Candidatus Gracilibacteria bacterium]